MNVIMHNNFSFKNLFQDDEAGIIPRAAFHIFEELSKLMRVETVVKVSYIELYNEEIRDLLSEDEGTLKYVEL